MAAKFLLALACVTLAQCSPALINGYLYRDGRGFSVGQAFANGYGGRATGSATADGGVLQAYGTASSADNQFARNGFGEVIPGQAVANAEVFDGPEAPQYGVAKAVAEAQNAPTFYYEIPQPAAIMYEQNFELPAQMRYQLPAGQIKAESSAIINGDSESSISTVSNDGAGSAQSSAQTRGVGNYGVTTSNANIYGGQGSASANANNGLGNTITSARTQGFGAANTRSQGGLGLTSAQSQTNGGYGSASSTVNNAYESAVATANTQGFGSANSNADINNAVASAKAAEQKGISWRFGTLYGTPSMVAPSILGQAQASSQTNGGLAKSTAHTNTAGYGNAQSSADTLGQGSANANANINGGYVNSAAKTYGYDAGVAKTVANTQGFGTANSEANTGLGSVKSTVNTNGFGFGNANADISGTGLKSSANTNGFGSASSSANNRGSMGSWRTNVYNPYGGSRTVANAQTSGQGSASSSANTQGIHAGYRVVNSSANTSGHGSAQANAQSI
ncbi:pneumococcal serine-rich repeat protein-like [Pieris rapae]|uniref:pneumococcal serine-rich repeat protein-like n=1 Tax=Pieris rapae TaxID=64459 RepID=UPI001E27BC9E|nr:pneumococcal serine-rich repeat protein-like [Pieris rapae]